MGYLKKFLVSLVVVFLTVGNGWAVASYAKKYGMVCKSCHTFGSELNNLGRTFKKNGSSFGENTVGTQGKKEQTELSTPTLSEISGINPIKPESLPQGQIDGSLPESETLEVEQVVPETIVYSCISSDGTPHYSDNPCLRPKNRMQGVPDKGTRKSSRSGFEALPVKIADKVHKGTKKTPGLNGDTSVLATGGTPRHPETHSSEKITVYQPKNYEDCMEKFFISSPAPTSPDDAMEQFREAKSRCVHYENKLKR